MKFEELGLHQLLAESLAANQFVDCTPIQESSIPLVLQGRDLAGLAQTGTGKTAAFLLPIMDRILRSKESPNSGPDSSVDGAAAPTDVVGADATSSEAPKESRPIFSNWRKTNFVLVLVPTRELAEQVYSNVLKLGEKAGFTAVAIYGGTSYEPQKKALQQGVDFIVATPGRLIDLYKEHLVDLNQVRAIVFDEADRMFDMGFKDDMKFILRRVPQDRQFLVFSATLNFDVLNTAYEFGANPIEVNVSRDQAKAENVIDEILHIGQFDKPKFLYSLIQKHKPQQTIVFSNFKHNVDRIAQFLSSNGIPALGISSLVSQNQRTRVMELFRNQSNDRNVLVATDVAARGLDIKGVDMVINFELPDDPENYVHRIGRTGRAGANGRALSLVSDRDVEALQRIESYLNNKITIGWIDDAEVAQDLKEFPRDESRRPSERSDRGGGDRRPGAGHKNFKKPFRSREQRDDQSGYLQKSGDLQNSQRPPQRDGARGESQRGPRSSSQNRGRGEGKPWQRDRNPSSPQRSAQGSSSGESPRGPAQTGRGSPRFDKFRKPQSGNGARPTQYSRPYKHRPGESSANFKGSVKSEDKGMFAKVSGFFKKLFS